MRESVHNHNDRPRAGDLVGFWRDGRPIFLPGGGSVDAGIESPPGTGAPGTPAGVIPVTIPPAAPAPPQPVTAETLASMRAQWQAEADARLAAREAELQETFNTRLAPFEQERAEREAEAQRLQEAAAEAERLRLASEETAAQRAERMQAETNAELQRMRDEMANRDALLAREQERNAVMEYRSAQLLEHANDIHPAMHELVGGFTREEIDASVGRATAATNKMLEEFAAAQGGVNQQLAALQRAQPGTSVTAPTAGPIEALGSQRMLSQAEIANLNPQQYEAMRPQLLAAASAAYHGTNGQQQ